MRNIAVKPMLNFDVTSRYETAYASINKLLHSFSRRLTVLPKITNSLSRLCLTK
jgi:hypothetical protein